MIRFVALFVTILALTSVSVVAQDENGCVDIDKNHGSLFDTPFVPSGTPLLSRFGFDLSHSRDNHIKQILVWPGLPPGMIRLDFSDDDPFGGFFTSNDDYCFNVTHINMVDARIRQVTRGLDICDAPQCTVPLDRPNGDFVFVLIGFQFSFREHDNHIKEIAILENNGQLTVAFHDRQFSPPDDTFTWSVQYAYVPSDRFSQVGEINGTRAHDRVIGAIPAGEAVLRGFRFIYQPYFTDGDDHHLQQISVRPSPGGSAFLVFRDDNGDDGFDWDYRWAIIRTLVVLPGEAAPPPVTKSPIDRR